MATESPVRLVESSGAGKWPSSMETVTFASSSNNMAVEELGLLLKGHRFHRNGRDIVPNRSGSAPPSMEGSVAAIGNLIAQQNPTMDESLTSLNDAIENCESEEQLRADPAYLAYYCSNVNLNPRLPPPLISNRRLVQHIGSLGNNWRSTSFDDSGNESLHLSRGALSTHSEEPEDDQSPRQSSGDWEESSGILSGRYTTSLTGRHKSLVDIIQEDFPRTPSPVYNQSRSSSHAATEEAADYDACAKSLKDPSIKAVTLSELHAGSGAQTLGGPVFRAVSNSDASSVSALNSSSPTGTRSPQPSQKGGSSSIDTQFEDDLLVTSVTDSDITSIESEMKAFNISSSSNSDYRNQKERHRHLQNSSQKNHMPQQRATSYQVQGAQAQIFSQGLSHPYGGLDLSHGHSKFSTVEVQPVLQSSGFTPPLYASATAYMTSGNPFYSSLQPSGLFSPQYNVGGYALNPTLMPPFIAGYPPNAPIPMTFDGDGGPGFNVRTGVSTGGSIAPGVDLQHLYKFYGQPGLTLQPSFSDPVYMQYPRHPSENAYRALDPYDSLTSRGSIIGTQVDAFDSQKGSPVPRGGLSIPSPIKGGITGPNYYGSPPSIGLLMQFPTSPVTSPILPASPLGEISLPGRRNEMRFSPSSSRNTATYSGWQGQRGTDRFDDPKTYSFLEELKSSKARRFELSDIAGRIVEFSADQHGSRFIQQKLENCSVEEKASVFREVLPHASKLIADVFGNYVIQKFFEYGSPEQRKELANQLVGHILPLSLQMYGCRVIQKALEFIDLDQKTQLINELNGYVMRCVRDQNGNHVIQKCIECVPTERIGFIISSFCGHVTTLSTHPYGCRVIQRVLEHCTDELQSKCIVDEILESACLLAQDQYGNYVTQHVLERGKPHERSQIISKLAGQIVQMSQHKFASNVVEKCLKYGDAGERELLIDEIIGQSEGNDNLFTMMKDQFANYVVQKILETCTDKQREILLNHIRIHLPALRKYTYGKHIVSRFEQLSGEEVHALER